MTTTVPFECTFKDENRTAAHNLKHSHFYFTSLGFHIQLHLPCCLNCWRCKLSNNFYGNSTYSFRFELLLLLVWIARMVRSVTSFLCKSSLLFSSLQLALRTYSFHVGERWVGIKHTQLPISHNHNFDANYSENSNKTQRWRVIIRVPLIFDLLCWS